DLAAATTTNSLHEILLAQERLVGRYQILHQPEFRELYVLNANKFLEGLAQLRQMEQLSSEAELASEFARYNGMAEKLFAGQNVPYTAMRKAAERVEKAIE